MVNATYFIEKVDCLNKKENSYGFAILGTEAARCARSKIQEKRIKSALLIAKASF